MPSVLHAGAGVHRGSESCRKCDEYQAAEHESPAGQAVAKVASSAYHEDDPSDGAHGAK